jgi:hypothetical protein
LKLVLLPDVKNLIGDINVEGRTTDDPNERSTAGPGTIQRKNYNIDVGF